MSREGIKVKALLIEFFTHADDQTSDILTTISITITFVQ